MKTYKAYKMVVDHAAIIPNPKWNRIERIVIAENEQDAKDSYNPAITGMVGAQHNVISCECIGDVSHFVNDDFKSRWNQDDGA